MRSGGEAPPQSFTYLPTDYSIHTQPRLQVHALHLGPYLPLFTLPCILSSGCKSATQYTETPAREHLHSIESSWTQIRHEIQLSRRTGTGMRVRSCRLKGSETTMQYLVLPH